MLENVQNPPSTNRGVTKPNTPNPINVRYDWFEGHVKLDIERVIADLSKALEGQYDQCLSSQTSKQVFHQRGWAYAYQFVKDEKPILTLSYGGQNHEIGVHFKTTGSTSHDMASILKSLYIPDGDLDFFAPSLMLCNRVDLAIDVFCDYNEAVEKCIAISDELGFSFGTAGDWVSKNPKTGRTLYLHRTKTDKMRIYEKGKEQREKGIDENSPLDWVRFELEIRAPKGKQNKIFKSIMSGLHPLRLLTAYKEYVALINTLGYDTLEYSHIARSTKPEPTSLERGLTNMDNQYHKVLEHYLMTPENFAQLILFMHPDPNDMPDHLKTTKAGFIALENYNYLKHGEY